MTRIVTSLRFKISVFVVFLLLVTASIFSLITLRAMNRNIMEEVIKRAESLCKSTAALAPYSLLANDVLGIDNIVSKVKAANSDVEYVVVTDAGMKVLAHTDVAKRDTLFHVASAGTIMEAPVTPAADDTEVYALHTPAGNLFEVLTPVIFNNKQIGNVILGINTSVLVHAQAETRRRIMAGIGISLFLGIGCVLVLTSFVTRPIQELSMGVHELKRGRRSKLRIYAHDELGSLTESFNHMAEMITRQQNELSMSARDLEEAYVSTVKVLAAAIDARDPYTLGHSTRVSQLSVKIGEALGLSRRELEDLEVASLFHDLGKLKTPDFVLLKEGPLNPLEHREMSEHSEHGAAILSRAKSLQKYIPAVRHHHEWFNGEGYPDGLRGEDIPLHAAIITVADSYDAMTSSRPYKTPRAPEEALHELSRYAGKQFDPRIVDIFCQVIISQPTLKENLSSGG
jgi:putative nucleotidyltransferase with HDIG domain